MSGEDLKEAAKADIDSLISKYLRLGLNSWELLGLFIRKEWELYRQAGAEYKMKGGQ